MNLLLPLQGRIRQEDGVGEEGSSDSKGEDETSEVARAPSRRSRRTTKPHVDSTQLGDTPAVLSEETHSELSSSSSPGTLPGDEDSSEGEEYAIPLTSDTTTAISSSTAGAVEGDDSHDCQSVTSPLIPEVPYLDGSIPPDQATDRVSMNKIVNWIVTRSPMILNKKTKVLHHQPQEGVPGAPKAYLLCVMEKSIYTAQSFQNWLNLPNINKPYMFPAMYIFCVLCMLMCYGCGYASVLCLCAMYIFCCIELNWIC